MEVVKRLQQLEHRIERLERLMEFEELTEEEIRELEYRRKKRDFIGEDEFWRELGV
ncbi:hypothetical protein [Thermococcus thioreducens]|uniref:Uncharacterized protein n=1 Tax=Thermococcus thioreducens TaxID=277988 RepID=A0A1I0MUT8_9EURY|nr:hypothetical protein [Thermococcus thioreducens]SEV92552.1 hypothetical protein SAMN05216170_0902 [Thermococcus thioreducens]